MNARRINRPHWLLLVIPYLWDVAAIPWASHVQIRIMEMPFLFVWMMVGIVITSATVGAVYVIDERHQVRNEEAE